MSPYTDKSQEIIAALEGVQNIPTLPAVIQKLSKAVRDPNADAARIAGIIEDDPAMMARILKVANSVLFGAVEPIHSLRIVVARMGLNAINNIAMSTSVFSAFPRNSSADFDPEGFWQHNISTGIATTVLYGRCKGQLSGKLDKNLMHLAGVLHDIGKIIFAQFYSDLFHEALRLAESESIPLCEAERRVIGADHAQVGEWLGARWNLSAELLQTIRWHHEPQQAEPRHRDLVMLCHSANYICNVEKLGDSGDASAPTSSQDVWTGLGLQAEALPEVVEQVREEAKNSEVLMSFL